MPRKEGKHWKESFMETSRVIFSQYTWVPPPIPITTFDNYVSVWWCYGTKRHWLFQLPKDASVKLKQPYMLNVCPFKIKSNSKHFKSSSMAQKHAKWQIFIHVKTFTLGEKTPKKPAKNENTGLVVILWSCFIRRPPVQEDHFWVFSRVVVLYRLDCISELEYACGYFNTSQFNEISIQKTSRVQISFIWILEYHWLTYPFVYAKY